MSEMQEVKIPLPLELFGWEYTCDECEAKIHISKHDPHPIGPKTTCRKCPNCKVKIRMIWYNEGDEEEMSEEDKDFWGDPDEEIYDPLDDPQTRFNLLRLEQRDVLLKDLKNAIKTILSTPWEDWGINFVQVKNILFGKKRARAAPGEDIDE